jgi:hypothetical protein
MLNLYKQLAFHSGEGPRKGRQTATTVCPTIFVGHVRTSQAE